MKAKAKIITMQSFKIQKIAKNDTASMNSQEIVGIKRHLLKLNNIFEDTMDQEKMINFYGHASNGTTASTDFPDDRQARLTHDRNE